MADGSMPLRNYLFSIENGAASHAELDPLYREHYAEMVVRLEGEGLPCAPYAPRLDEYFKAMNGGWLITYVARLDGVPVAYSNIWLTNDMHNGELIAQEDALFATKAHRSGVGRKLTKFLLEDLRNRGVKRGYIQAVTDPRVGHAWQRLGFKPIGQVMVYRFDEPGAVQCTTNSTEEPVASSTSIVLS